MLSLFHSRGRRLCSFILPLMASCAAPTEPASVAQVAVTTPTVSIASGATVQLVAAVLDARGGLLASRPISWSSSDLSLATVSASGLVSAGRVLAATDRPVTIAATSGAVSGSITLFVRPVPVATVTLSPASPTLAAGATVQLSATTRDATGVELTGRTVTWTASDTSIALVSGAGTLSAKAYSGPDTRTAIITAQSEGQSGAATVTVTPAPVASVTLSLAAVTIAVGATQQVAAIVRDAAGTALAGRTVSWSSSDTLVASVSASGLISARAYSGAATRTAIITAQSEGKSATMVLTVSASPVDAVEVSPSAAAVAVGSSAQLTAITRDAGGALLTGRAVTWVSSDTTIAKVSSSGVVSATPYTGPSTRSATITASDEGKSAAASITVTPAPVATVSIAPETFSVGAGKTQQLVAILRDADGSSLTGRIVSWSSSDTTVATVGVSGLVTAKAYGGPDVRTAIITATSEGRNGSAAVTVSPAAVSSVLLTPSPATVGVGAKQLMTATLLDAAGMVLTGRTISWSTSDAAKATVSNAGLVTGVSPGGLTVTAISGGVSGSAAMTVFGTAIASVDAAPAELIPSVGTTRQLTVTLRDAAGGALSGRVVSWRSTNGSTAAVSVDGVLFALSAGEAKVIAASEGVEDTVSVTVVAPGTAPTRQTIAVGYRHACALTADGSAYCWGSNQSGELGNGTNTSSAVPVAVAGGQRFSSIHIGPARDFTCGLTATGEVFCWGANTDAQLGDSSTTNRSSPVRAASGLSFREIATDHRGVCGLQTDGAILCWGNNQFGQLGDGTTTNRSTPVRAQGIVNPLHVYAGIYVSCAMSQARQVYCWGQLYQATDGTRILSATPTLMAAGAAFAEFSVGVYTLCGRRLDGVTLCWGQNLRGELGDGTETDRANPTPVFGDPAFATSNGGYGYRCELSIAGKPSCWGRGFLDWNVQGQNTTIPVALSGGTTLRTIATYGFGCGLDADGRAYCWGPNDQGNIGDGTKTFRSVPTAVSTSVRFAIP